LAYTKPNDFLLVLLASLEAPNPVSLTGPSVEEAFKSHLGSLAPTSASQSHSQPIPSLYSILKTFWLPSSPSYFALTASASTARTPSEHRFLYWDPQPLVFNGIACPSCTAPLANRGRIRSGPIKVHDLDGPFFVIGCEYVCASAACGDRRFASTDAAIHHALPHALQREFPARLVHGDAGSGADVWNWQARGVSRAMWNLVSGGLRTGLGKEVILQLVRNIQHGVPEASETELKEERMEEEEEAEDAPHEQDVVMEPAEPPVHPPAPVSEAAVPPPANRQTSTEAFNDAWTANTAVASTSDDSDPAAPTAPALSVDSTTQSSSPSQPGSIDLRNNPYARLTMPLFPVPAAGPTIIAYDPATLKRPYPFAADVGAGAGLVPGAGASASGSGRPSSGTNRATHVTAASAARRRARARVDARSARVRAWTAGSSAAGGGTAGVLTSAAIRAGLASRRWLLLCSWIGVTVRFICQLSIPSFRLLQLPAQLQLRV
ncbi:hypothetical protein B0H10DRAFT_769357, partial [Mycena sp. CBHHK59/15]